MTDPKDQAKTANPFAVDRPRQQQSASLSVAEAREVAEIQAGMLIAQRFPRDQIVAMDRILDACTRPSLAETALYEYSKGGTKIEGPSIRLAEVLAQNWGHIHMGVRELSQTHGESTVEAYAYDVQTGTRDSKVFQVRHWRDTKSGGYKIEDSREIYELVANVGARRKRACILAVIPGDVVEAAVAQCEKTMMIKAEVTPERLKELVAFFATFGVSTAAIEKRIQRRLEAMTPGQLLGLGKIANSLKDGMSAAADWFELGETATIAPAAGAPEPPKGGVEKAKAAARVRAAKEKPTETAPPQGPQPPDDLDQQQEQDLERAAIQSEPPLERVAPPRQGPTLAEVNKLLQGTADEYNAALDLIRSLPPQEQSQAAIIARQERKRFGG